MDLLCSDSILDNLKAGKSQGSWKGLLLTPGIWCYPLGNVASSVLRTWEQGIPFELVIPVFCGSKWRQSVAHRWSKSKNKGFLDCVRWCFRARWICLSFHSIRFKRWTRRTVGSSRAVRRVSQWKGELWPINASIQKKLLFFFGVRESDLCWLRIALTIQVIHHKRRDWTSRREGKHWLELRFPLSW